LFHDFEFYAKDIEVVLDQQKKLRLYLKDEAFRLKISY